MLVRGLSTVASQLLVLHLDGVALHGTSLSPVGGAPCFPHMQDLTLMAKDLIRSKYPELARLHELRCLTLTGVCVGVQACWRGHVLRAAVQVERAPSHPHYPATQPPSLPRVEGPS